MCGFYRIEHGIDTTDFPNRSFAQTFDFSSINQREKYEITSLTTNGLQASVHCKRTVNAPDTKADTEPMPEVNDDTIVLGVDPNKGSLNFAGKMNDGNECLGDYYPKRMKQDYAFAIQTDEYYFKTGISRAKR